MAYDSAPPIAVDLTLSVGFLFASRWIKRNPSNFLRYILFPFGGLNVERWPRVLLAIVRVCAILAFFAFLLTIVNLLAPESLAHPTPLVLYTKFAVCMLISFFALRGITEHAESDATPEARPLAPPPGSRVNSAPATPRVVPAPPKAASPAAKSPSAVPVAHKPALAAAKANVSAPASGPVPSRLSDVEAPPVPNRSNPLIPPPPGVVRARLATIRSTFFMGVIFIAFFYFLGVQWLVIAFLCFFSFALVVLFFGRNAMVGGCPFCGGLIERYNRLRPEPVRCDQCNEISKFENERFSPYDPNAVSATPIFRSPLFENALWPNGCVLCGASPVRFDEAKAVRYQRTAPGHTPRELRLAPPPSSAGNRCSLLRASSGSHPCDSAKGDDCLDSVEIFPRIRETNGRTPEGLSDVALASDDAPLSGSEPSSEERQLHWLSRAESPAEDGLRRVFKVCARHTWHARPARKSQQNCKLKLRSEVSG